MSGTPQQNGVSKRCNGILMDMITSMLSNCNLPIFLWIYELKTVMYLLNRVLNKVVPKTYFGLWTNRTPSIRYMHFEVAKHK